MKRIVIIFLISGLSLAAGAQTQKQPAKAEPAKTPTTQPAKQAVSPLTEHFYKKYITALAMERLRGSQRCALRFDHRKSSK
jgi:hypothetical protein